MPIPYPLIAASSRGFSLQRCSSIHLYPVVTFSARFTQFFGIRIQHVKYSCLFLSRIQKMFDLLKEQSEMLKEIRQTTQENIEISREEAKQEEPATKSLFGVKDRLSFSPPSFF